MQFIHLISYINIHCNMNTPVWFPHETFSVYGDFYQEWDLFLTDHSNPIK